MYQDETLQCEDCGKEFVFTAGEQEFYAEKGLVNKPKRCPECRQQRRQKSKKGFMMPFAQNAAHKQKFRSNPLKEKKSIAKNASTKDNNKHKTKDLRKTGFAKNKAKPVF